MPGATKDGTAMLSDLSNEFLNSKYDFDKIRAAVRTSRRQSEEFFIPTEPVGSMFVQCKALPSGTSSLDVSLTPGRLFGLNRKGLPCDIMPSTGKDI
jgi:hypothetical protein